MPKFFKRYNEEINQALKDAKESVDRGITNMNPNPSSFYKKSGIAELRALDFSKWIIDGMGIETWNDMRETEIEYFNKDIFEHYIRI